MTCDRGPRRTDAEARQHAVDPARNVVLEASAGTGKTRVLVERYINLLRAGVDPNHILAITFTRKAAAEMRQRILERLHEGAQTSELEPARWRDVRARLGDIAISTIDAFCLSLVREFPLEADVDPAFTLADETQIPRLIDEALDSALRTGRRLAEADADVAMVLVQLGERRLRAGLAVLLDRRLLAREALPGFLQRGPRDLTPEVASTRAAERFRDVLTSVPGGLASFLEDGPLAHPQFAMLAADLRGLCTPGAHSFRSREEQATFRMLAERIGAYWLTQDGKPRKSRGFTQGVLRAVHCRSEARWRRHRDAAEKIAPGVLDMLKAFRRDLNVIASHGVWRLFQVADVQYRRTLETYTLLDFSEVLARALELLTRMDEFSRSRYKLEARYHHVLVDEFQDTSRAQWDLVALLIRSWGEGLGVSSGALQPSIFIVGDRKQSIYGFRDADVEGLGRAAQLIGRLRPDDEPRRSISVSFRARAPILAFINALFGEIAPLNDGGDTSGRDRFRFDETDHFPVEMPSPEQAVDLHTVDGQAVDDAAVRLLVGETVEAAANRVADEIVGLLARGAAVRDRHSGLSRPVTPGDIAVLFRSRDSHQAYETALERRAVPTYVYKGLGFFDADEILDAMALLRFLADPTSDLRAASLLRSGIVRVSDQTLARLGPRLARAIIGPDPQALSPPGSQAIGEPVARADDEAVGETEEGEIDVEDQMVLGRLRESIQRWLALVDQLSPAELIDELLAETGYTVELCGSHAVQARENLKKLRSLVRRIQNRGYATLARIANHLDQLALGDEANAVVDALQAVHLMTVHAAKGLEFPIVFVVNLGRGTAGPRSPIRMLVDGRGTPSVSIGDFESEADEESSAREREEAKRLLYVAVTRARDRLYLSAVLKESRFKAGRGSLGEVLPRSLVEELERAGCAPSRDQHAEGWGQKTRS